MQAEAEISLELQFHRQLIECLIGLVGCFCLTWLPALFCASLLHGQAYVCAGEQRKVQLTPALRLPESTLGDMKRGTGEQSDEQEESTRLDHPFPDRLSWRSMI